MRYDNVSNVRVSNSAPPLLFHSYDANDFFSLEALTAEKPRALTELTADLFSPWYKDGALIIALLVMRYGNRWLERGRVESQYHWELQEGAIEKATVIREQTKEVVERLSGNVKSMLADKKNGATNKPPSRVGGGRGRAAAEKAKAEAAAKQAATVAKKAAAAKAAREAEEIKKEAAAAAMKAVEEKAAAEEAAKAAAAAAAPTNADAAAAEDAKESETAEEAAKRIAETKARDAAALRDATRLATVAAKEKARLRKEAADAEAARVAEENRLAEIARIAAEKEAERLRRIALVKSLRVAEVAFAKAEVRADSASYHCEHYGTTVAMRLKASTQLKDWAEIMQSQQSRLRAAKGSMKGKIPSGEDEEKIRSASKAFDNSLWKLRIEKARTWACMSASAWCAHDNATRIRAGKTTLAALTRKILAFLPEDWLPFPFVPPMPRRTSHERRTSTIEAVVFVTSREDTWAEKQLQLSIASGLNPYAAAKALKEGKEDGNKYAVDDNDGDGDQGPTRGTPATETDPYDNDVVPDVADKAWMSIMNGF